jgi:hypothetical protein
MGHRAKPDFWLVRRASRWPGVRGQGPTGNHGSTITGITDQRSTGIRITGNQGAAGSSRAKSSRTSDASAGTRTVNHNASASMAIENSKKAQQVFSRRASSAAAANTVVDVRCIRSCWVLVLSAASTDAARKRRHSSMRSSAAAAVSEQAMGTRTETVCHAAGRAGPGYPPLGNQTRRAAHSLLPWRSLSWQRCPETRCYETRCHQSSESCALGLIWTGAARPYVSRPFTPKRRATLCTRSATRSLSL